jgi:hypothetical protein
VRLFQLGGATKPWRRCARDALDDELTQSWSVLGDAAQKHCFGANRVRPVR